jgi:acyl carrier protein
MDLPNIDGAPTEVGTESLTAIEAALTKIWREVLRNKSLGADDNFSDVGGDSMSAAVVITRICDELGVELQFMELFKEQTIRNVSRRILAIKTSTV